MYWGRFIDHSKKSRRGFEGFELSEFHYHRMYYLCTKHLPKYLPQNDSIIEVLHLRYILYKFLPYGVGTFYGKIIFQILQNHYDVLLYKEKINQHYLLFFERKGHQRMSKVQLDTLQNLWVRVVFMTLVTCKSLCIIKR